MDSQDYLLPHRRTRAWGLAAVTGEEEVCRLPSSFPSCLEELASRVKIPNDQFFLPAKEVPIKPGRQAEVLEQAAELYGRENLYVDVSTSTKRTMAAANVVPCVTPSHPIYSTRLNRYLLKEEFLRVQGLWPSCFKEDVYEEYIEMGQNLAGNSFSSTVCQAAIIASMVTCPKSWEAIPSRRGDPQSNPVDSSAPAGIPMLGCGDTVLRRITGKRKAEAYDCFKNHSQNKPSKSTRRRRKMPWRRKAPGVDSRKLSKGKKKMVTISDKLKVLLGTH